MSTTVPLPRPTADDTAGTPDRRLQILEAAERCFARAGFHRTTMQEVAVEAGMSPGNLYRYFASKDDLVAGQIDRNRARVSEDFTRLLQTSDFMAAFAALGRKYFEDDPIQKTIVCLEIWAEAAHNPAFAAMHEAIDRDISTHMLEAFRRAQAQGVIPSSVNIETVERIISLLADGLMVRRALDRDFDARRDIREVICLIGALLKDVSYNALISDPAGRPQGTQP